MIESGRLSFEGPTAQAIAHYQHKLLPGQVSLEHAVRKGPRQDLFRFTGLHIEKENRLQENSNIVLRLEFKCHGPVHQLVLGLLIADAEGTKILELRYNQNK